MKLHIIPDRCCGAQTCAMVAPEIYAINEEGFNAFVNAPESVVVSPDLEMKAIEGASACPESAIVIED
ncbi:ferredoxin [Sphingobium sp. Sx8-8]|uniref:ferredoxin n=1 Tax=Sphingobium sp. Sx8-8 TaxID=2933617 RepID=UPI001F58AD7A|nr:ferredoxin [Sphingobium sp. Sx8-8]